MRKQRPVTERFWKYVTRGAADECWLWQGSLTAEGYGVISRGPGQKLVYAHRLSYEIHNGTFPAAFCVCHTCDVRSCVNPSHLFLGTIADNNLDMFAKGRDVQNPKFGAANHSAKLTEDQVRAIRDLYAQGMSQTELSRMFSVSQSNISDIVRRNIWRHVT